MFFIRVAYIILIFLSFNLFANCVSPQEEFLSEKINNLRVSNAKKLLPLIMNPSENSFKLEIKINNNHDLDKIAKLFYQYKYLKVILNRSEYSKKTWIALSIKLTKKKLNLYFIERQNDKELAIICSNRKLYNLAKTASSFTYSTKHLYYDTEQYSWLIKPKYEAVDNSGKFSENLIAVKNSDYNWGYINKKGEEVIKFIYKNAKNFNNDYAKVNYSYLIDKNANQIKFKNKKIIYAYKNAFLVKDNNGLMFFVDKNEKILSKKYKDIGYFSDGLAIYMGKNKKNRYVYGYLDENFQAVIKAKYSDAFAFSQGLAGVKYRGKWGFINKKGKFVIKPKYKKKIIYQFKEDLAVVPIAKKFAYINKKGKIVIKAKYDNAWGFSKDGLAAVKKAKKWGFINKKGELVIPFKYASVGYFHDGLAKVRIGKLGNKGAWGFIDKKGKFKINPQFSDVKDNNNGIIAVAYSGIWGIIKIQ